MYDEAIAAKSWQGVLLPTQGTAPSFSALRTDRLPLLSNFLGNRRHALLKLFVGSPKALDVPVLMIRGLLSTKSVQVMELLVEHGDHTGLHLRPRMRTRMVQR